MLDRLAALADEVKAEGWKWVEYAAAQPDDLYRMGRVYPLAVDLSEVDQAALDQLQADYDSLAELIEAGNADTDAETRLEGIETAIAALTAREEAYQPEDLARAGAFLHLDYYGGLSISRGLVKQEAAVTAPRGDEDGDEDSDTSEQETAEPANVISHSATLIEDLTAQKTAALRLELANNADIALVAVVHATLLSVAYRSMYGAQSALQISLTHERLEGSMKKPDANPALEQWESLKENYGHKLPGDPADLWDWLLDQSRDELLTLMAYAAAHTVNAVEGKYSGDRKRAFAHADLLGQSLNVQMGDYFTPTGDSYFSHLNRKSIEAAIVEAKGDEAALAVKAAARKAEAVLIAERLVKGSGWLPANIRLSAAVEDEDEGQSVEIHPFPVAAE